MLGCPNGIGDASGPALIADMGRGTRYYNPTIPQLLDLFTDKDFMVVREDCWRDAVSAASLLSKVFRRLDSHSEAERDVLYI